MTRKTKTEATRETLKIEDFTVSGVKTFDNGGILFNLTVNGITIYGCNVRTNKNKEDFISLPQRLGKDGKYYSIVYFRLSDEDQKDILSEIEKQL